MSNSSKSEHSEPSSGAEPARQLTPAAQRALAEAEERRQLLKDTQSRAQTPEIGGAAGPEPVRYGDWEKGGIAWDF
ncbi:MAG: DUF1674 domain-containing protein [Hyphomicrobiaceae bacterium]|nr:DUF1674 domain-containing protein [Hyphomicrobiaceae bacterium]